MNALRKNVIVKNHKIKLTLPECFAENEELEVIVLSKENRQNKVVNNPQILDEAFGIWQTRDISKEIIRKKAWG